MFVHEEKNMRLEALALGVVLFVVLIFGFGLGVGRGNAAIIVPVDRPTTDSPSDGLLQRISSVLGDIVEVLEDGLPAIRVLAAASAVSVATSVVVALVPGVAPGFGAFIWQRLLGFLGLLPRRKKVWGTIYDSNTKRPVPYAKVQLLDRSRRVLETRVADKDGRYGFLTTPESLQAQNIQVTIEPAVPDYVFPSRVSPSIDMFVYNNLYYGALITVSEKTLINLDVPMDPTHPSPAPLFVKSPSIAAGAAVAAFADAGFWFGLVAVPLAWFLNPNPFTLGVVFLFLGTSSLRIFGIKEQPFGTVKNAQTRRAMSFALVTLNDLSGKRVAFAVSDEKGRYFLVVERGDYELVVHTPATVQPSRRYTHPIHVKKGWITRTITF